MPALDPAVERVLTALVGGLRTLDVRFCVVGALVPELLLAERPAVRTNDADAVVMVADLAAFEAVKAGLVPAGFSPTRLAHRLGYAGGGVADLLPYGRELAPDGILRLAPDSRINLAGFECLSASAVDVALDSGLVVPVAPLPLFVLLKLVAYTDRRAEKDLEAVEHVLRHYAEDDDRRFGLESVDGLVPYECGPAYLAGLDGAEFPDATLRSLVGPLLEQLGDAPSPSRDEDERRLPREELFAWYRRGLAL